MNLTLFFVVNVVFPKHKARSVRGVYGYKYFRRENNNSTSIKFSDAPLGRGIWLEGVDVGN